MKSLHCEEILHGGFAFNGLTDMLTMRTDFWSDSVKEFGQNLTNDELIFLDKLSWFESPTPHSTARYTPMYGCYRLEDNKFPEAIYFYDSGTVYNLDMTLETYIANMIESAAVNCWQYFYISPEELIKKNKGVNGSLWMLSSLEDFPEDSDRLGNILHHMDHCIQYLPDSFPWKDFSYHNKQLELIKSMI
ncbi:hypothetical protein [Spirochaeta cellobiosiphila]|uniref:hypothetical protein n=1 Tax=Spirochaeta cellobiosiphila TaxID=504483 RepID=UPI0004171DDD|nr:hypothetical protein [Spirochaeta cellobiosiphila]